jgi:GntR family transcriptional regulator, rspAB operon transcriptional repressor
MKRQPSKTSAKGASAGAKTVHPAAGSGAPRTASILDQNLPKTAQVYERLRAAIVSLNMPPGAAINEKDISQQLGVSRTPVREALLQLAGEDLVVMIPHSGTFVSRIRLNDVFEGQLVRDALEMRVVRLAAEKFSEEYESRIDFILYQQTAAAKRNKFREFHRLDEDFHRTICECGASGRVWRIINGAKAQLDRVRFLGFPNNDPTDVLIAQHTAIFQALQRKEPDDAARFMQRHLDAIHGQIQVLIVEKREFFSEDAATYVESLEAIVNRLALAGE